MSKIGGLILEKWQLGLSFTSQFCRSCPRTGVNNYPFSISWGPFLQQFLSRSHLFQPPTAVKDLLVGGEHRPEDVAWGLYLLLVMFSAYQREVSIAWCLRYFPVLGEDQRCVGMCTQSSGTVVEEWSRGSKSDIRKVHTWLCFLKLNRDRTEWPL